MMDSDKMLMNMLTEAHRPFVIVLTKADKLKEGQLATRLKETGD
jgi:GTP-binding protein EngB required for normal cell division